VSEDIGSILVRELLRFAEPITEAAGDADTLQRLFADLGWHLDAITGLPVTELTRLLNAVSDAATALSAVSLPPEDFDELTTLLATAADLGKAITALAGLFDSVPASRPIGFDKIGGDLIQLLTLRYLARYLPGLLSLLELLGVVRPVPTGPPTYEYDQVTGAVIRFPRSTPVLELAQVPALLSDPVGTLRKRYAGEGPVLDSTALARELFAVVDGALVRVIDGAGLYRLDAGKIDPGVSGAAGARLLGSSALLQIPIDLGSSLDGSRLGAVVTVAGSDLASLGLLVTPIGTLTFIWRGSSWVVELGGSFSGGTVSLTMTGVRFSDPDPEVRLDITATRTGVADGPAVLIGSPGGTRLEIATFTAAATIDLDGGQPPDVGVLVDFGQAAVAVAAGDGDGFLAKVLPPGGFRVDFDLAVGWSTRRGLYFRGAAQLDVHIPVHSTFLGVLTLETVDLSLRARSDPAPGVIVVTAATATVHLGPVTASVEQIGLELRVTFPEGGGNTGPANLALGFHPPVGAALAISATVVSGGGYLRADHANGRYGGVLQLEIADVVNATAIASLAVSPNPAQPDAPRSYSLLLILVAEFPPLQLGFGFTLNGLGGIFGANRTINLVALRAGVRTRALDSILFPQDAAANAVRILRDVEAVFPPAQGQFVIGLMARFGWGSPRLITIDVGIIIELPSPLRIVLLGRLSLALPKADAAVVELHLDVVGILDITNKNASIDATLYDSRVAAFTISGDMAARLNYGAEPGLAISAGGFNPRFSPPPDFPELRRLAISLGDGDNPRIRLEAYLANTTNSIQMGARLEVYVEADLGRVLGVFSATAYLSFDALITLVPFSFVVDLAGGVEIRRNGSVLFGAQLLLSLSGPQPVRAWGYAQFDFFGRRRIPFDHTFGPDPLELVIAVADPVGALLAALADPRNWETQLPAAAPTTASLRELPPAPEGTVLTHPLGRMGVRQRIVPLDVPIDRFAGAPVPEAARMLHVSVSLGGKSAVGTPVRDAFPTGESLDLTDDEKLSREQFSQWPCGLTGIGLADTPVSAGAAVTGAEGYETRVVDPVQRTRRGGTAGYNPADALLNGFLDRGAVGAGPLHRSGVAAHLGPGLGIIARPARYRVLDETDLTIIDIDGKGRTEYESESEAIAARDRSPGTVRRVVAGAHEGAAP
jgi:hypothetical protein